MWLASVCRKCSRPRFFAHSKMDEALKTAQIKIQAIRLKSHA